VQEGRKWLFRVNFFPFKSAWIFACAFQFSRRTFSCIFFWLKCSCSALLRSLCTLRYICLRFSQKRSANQPKKIQRNGLLLNWKAHAKIQALLKENKLAKKVTYVPLAPSHSIIVRGLHRLGFQNVTVGSINRVATFMFFFLTRKCTFVLLEQRILALIRRWPSQWGDHKVGRAPLYFKRFSFLFLHKKSSCQTSCHQSKHMKST